MQPKFNHLHNAFQHNSSDNKWPKIFYQAAATIGCASALGACFGFFFSASLY